MPKALCATKAITHVLDMKYDWMKHWKYSAYGLDVTSPFGFSTVLSSHLGTPPTAVWYVAQSEMKSEEKFDPYQLAKRVSFANFSRKCRSCVGI